MSELTTLFQNTADAIRSKTGDTAPMQASQFPAKIQGISVGISQDEADARYLQLSGGTMTGDLILNGAPTADNQAATKAYVDGKAGGMQLVGTDTRSFTETTAEAYTLSPPIAPNKPVMVELIVHQGALLKVNASTPQDSAFWVADYDIINFDDIAYGTLTLPEISGYRMFFPTMTRVSNNLTEQYYFYSIAGITEAHPVLNILSAGITVKFVINAGTYFTGTVTTNIYQ